MPVLEGGTCRLRDPVRRADTRHPPRRGACLDRLITQRLAPRGRAVSPLGAMRAAADCLERDAATAERVWVVRADAREPSADAGAHRRISAWPLRFLDARKRFESRCCTAACARDRPAAAGVGRNHRSRDLRQRCRNGRVVQAERRDARCPHWLAANPACTPYDPASGHEAIAILRHALRTLCRRPAGILLPREPRRSRTRCETAVGHRGPRCVQRHGAGRPARRPARLRRSGCAARAARSRRCWRRPTCCTTNGASIRRSGAARATRNSPATVMQPTGGTCCIRTTNRASHMCADASATAARRCLR